MKYILFYAQIIIGMIVSFQLPSTDRCRCQCTTPQLYPESRVKRIQVQPERIKWSESFQEYDPPDYTSPKLEGKSYADPNIGSSGFAPKWNQIDGNISRISCERIYDIVNGYPQNPIGRTGIRGRGRLGRWGPNQAADVIATTWKRDDFGNIITNHISNRSILQFIAIKGTHTDLWVLPGGMVEPGETPAVTAARELIEETLNSTSLSRLDAFFKTSHEILKSYIDDERNTDNAWVESNVYHFHDESGEMANSVQLEAGDDASALRWMVASHGMEDVYACHADFISLIVQKMDANW